MLLYQVIIGYMRKKSKRLKKPKFEEKAEMALVAEKD